MKLLKKKPRSFEIQVQDLVLHISAAGDVNEESRAAALSFWEQLQAYALRDPEVRTSKRPMQVPEDAPAVLQELIRAAATAGVGPMFSFRGALTDHVGRFLAPSTSELTVSCGGDHFIIARRRRKLTVHRAASGRTIAVVVGPSREGIGVSTAFESGRAPVDGLAVLASSCMLADAAAAGVQALLAKPNGFRMALDYLRRVPGVTGGLLVQGDRIGVAGGVEIAA